MKAELVPDNGDPAIVIRRDITVIGRKDNCDVRIEHPTISKKHCIVVRTAGLLIMRDLATTNGTKVKGQRVRWAALLPGDKVSIGGYKLRVYLGPDDAPSPSEVASKQSMYGGEFERPTPTKLTPPPLEPVPPPPRAPRPIELGEADLVDDELMDKFRFPSSPDESSPIVIDLD